MSLISISFALGRNLVKDTSPDTGGNRRQGRQYAEVTVTPPNAWAVSTQPLWSANERRWKRWGAARAGDKRQPGNTVRCRAKATCQGLCGNMRCGESWPCAHNSQTMAALLR